MGKTLKADPFKFKNNKLRPVEDYILENAMMNDLLQSITIKNKL